MRKIFKNEEYEAAITKKGYVILHQLISENTCDELQFFFTQNVVVDNRAFTISNWNNNETYRKVIYDKVCELLLPASSQVLENYKPVLAVFTVKRPGAKSDMLLHQDWSLVEESKFRSVSIWVALCDMTSSNGNLQVAAYSHIYAPFPRGMNMSVPFENIRNKIHESYLTDIPLKKGDAVIFDHKLIHASPENSSEQLRLAAVLALIPDEAELIHYYKHEKNETELEVLKLSEEEFRIIDFFNPPYKPKHQLILKTVANEYRQITVEEIENTLYQQHSR